jgi:hypothetical protein
MLEADLACNSLPSSSGLIGLGGNNASEVAIILADSPRVLGELAQACAL